MKYLKGTRRHDILQLLGNRTNLTGVELGVAGGGFSARMVSSGKFDTFFGIDMYADTHDVNQYKQALRHVGLFSPYKLLRMSFSQAYDLFEDESLDFIYIDGYAHSGQEGGETIWHWARKVKQGGLIAGDDYHSDWPLVKDAVDAFTGVTGFELNVTTIVEPDIDYAAHPSWGMIKTAKVTGEPPAEMVHRGKTAAAKVARKRAVGKRLGDWLHRLVGDERYAQLREWNRTRKQNRKA